MNDRALRTLGLLAVVLIVVCVVVSDRYLLGPQLREAVGQVVPVELQLIGPLASPSAEVSGLAWYGDTLVLLPQYPDQMPCPHEACLFSLPRDAIERAIDAPSATELSPMPVELRLSGAVDVDGFEGFEAVAFVGQRVFLLAESETASASCGHLFIGEVEGDLERIHVDAHGSTLVPPTHLPNLAYEALVPLGDDIVLVLLEVNAAPNEPVALMVQLDPDGRQTVSEVEMPALEYRLTDATAVDDEGRFHVLNVYWPDSQLRLAEQPLIPPRARDGRNELGVIERTLELVWSGPRVQLMPTTPIQISSIQEGAATTRNWEGLARFGARGFLLVTDEYPETMLVFAPVDASGFEQ